MILGTVELGLDYGVNNCTGKPSYQQALEILDAAWEGGIRELDTATLYGDSEEIIGLYQNETGNSFFIDTKLPISVEESLETSFRLSCKKLNTNHINILYLHSFAQCKDKRTVEFLKRKKADGDISHIGVSIYEPFEMEYILANLPEIDAIQFPYNLFDNQRWEVDGLLKRAVDEKKCLFARSIFLQGLFFQDALNGFVTQLGVSEYINAIKNIALDAGMTIAEMAYMFVLGKAEIKDVILGCQKKEEVMDNLELEKSGKILTRKIRLELELLSKNIPLNAIDPRNWKRCEA